MHDTGVVSEKHGGTLHFAKSQKGSAQTVVRIRKPKKGTSTL